MTDAKVIAPFAVLHACAMALGVGMLVVLLRGTQEPRPDDSDGPAALVGSRRARDRLSDPSAVDCRSPTRSRPGLRLREPVRADERWPRPPRRRHPARDRRPVCPSEGNRR